MKYILIIFIFCSCVKHTDNTEQDDSSVGLLGGGPCSPYCSMGGPFLEKIYDDGMFQNDSIIIIQAPY